MGKKDDDFLSKNALSNGSSKLEHSSNHSPPSMYKKFHNACSCSLGEL
jgi:hypothetical protein